MRPADAAARRDRDTRRDQRRQRERTDDDRLPDHRGSRLQQPAESDRDHGARRRQRAAQVVEHLPATRRRDRERAAPAPEDPRQQLPVAARPAVQPLDRDLVARREVLDDLDVGREAGACVDAFEQVVAEHRVVGHAAGERRLERVDVVDALADVRPFAGEVLVDVRHGARVRIDAAWAGEGGVEDRAGVGGDERRGDARLQDRVAARDALQPRVEERPVERMTHLADETQRRVARQSRVGIERDDVADPVGHAVVRREERRVGRAAQQPVQLVQLAALAFAAHPRALRAIEHASPVQRREARSARPGGVARVQVRDRRVDDGQQRQVVVAVLAIAVGPVGHDREVELARRARQVMHLERRDLLADLVGRRQQRRHRDQRPRVGVGAAREVERRQGDRRDGARHRDADDRRRRLAERNEREQREHRQPAARDRRVGDERQRDREQRARQREDRDRVAVDAESHVEAREPLGERRHEAERMLERRTPFGDQVVAGVAVAGTLDRVLPARAGRRGDPQHPLRDLDLGVARPSRQRLDRVAVQVARREVVRGVGAALTQRGVDRAHRLEEVGPVQARDRAQRRDDVARRDVRGAVALLRALHDGVDRPAVARQTLLEPPERRRRRRVLVAQPPRERGAEDVDERSGGGVPRGVERRALVEAGREGTVGERVGLRGGAARAVELVGDASQILDEDDAQRDRDGPQLADRQQLDGLVGVEEALQDVRIEVAVGVRDERPRDAEDARVAGERTVLELRQLAIEAARKQRAHLADLLVDEVVVVEQPLRRRGIGIAALGRQRARAIGREQRVGVVVQATVQRRHARRAPRDRLRRGEAAAVLLQPIDAEQLLADRRLAGPHRGGRRTRVEPEEADHRVGRRRAASGDPAA